MKKLIFGFLALTTASVFAQSTFSFKIHNYNKIQTGYGSYSSDDLFNSSGYENSPNVPHSGPGYTDGANDLAGHAFDFGHSFNYGDNDPASDAFNLGHDSNYGYEKYEDPARDIKEAEDYGYDPGYALGYDWQYSAVFSSHNLDGSINPQAQTIYCGKSDDSSGISYNSSDYSIHKNFLFESYEQCVEVYNCMKILGKQKSSYFIQIETDRKSKIIDVELSSRCKNRDPLAMESGINFENNV